MNKNIKSFIFTRTLIFICPFLFMVERGYPQTNNVNIDTSNPCGRLIRELDRIGIDIKKDTNDYAIASTERLVLLQQLTDLYQSAKEKFDLESPNPDINQPIAITIKGKLAELGAIPVWDGKKWIDERKIAMSDRSIGVKAAKALAFLNYWDRNFGELQSHKAPESYKVGGEASTAIQQYKEELKSIGMNIVANPHLKVWQITDTSTNPL